MVSFARITYSKTVRVMRVSEMVSGGPMTRSVDAALAAGRKRRKKKEAVHSKERRFSIAGSGWCGEWVETTGADGEMDRCAMGVWLSK